jgi:hypothetical protein
MPGGLTPIARLVCYIFLKLIDNLISLGQLFALALVSMVTAPHQRRAHATKAGLALHVK